MDVLAPSSQTRCSPLLETHKKEKETICKKNKNKDITEVKEKGGVTYDKIVDVSLPFNSWCVYSSELKVYICHVT